MSRPRKVTLAAALAPEVYAAIKRISAETRVPMAVHIRDAVDAWLSARREPQPQPEQEKHPT